MSQSLHRAGHETHVRIVAVSLAAAIAIVIGALNAKPVARGDIRDSWTAPAVVKALRSVLVSTGERPPVQ
jgi:hypothetical protein